MNLKEYRCIGTWGSIALLLGPLTTLGQSKSYTTVSVLVAVYRNSNKGSLPSTITQDLQSSLDTAGLFYWRNSHMSFLPRWTILDVDTQVGFVQDNGYIWPADVENDLRSRGYPDNAYDAVCAIAQGSGNFAWGVNRLLGKTGYCQTGWWGSDPGAWYITHEFNHVVDSMFEASGFPDYPSNHPGAARSRGEYVPNSGPDWDVNAGILRYWRPENWVALGTYGRWGLVAQAIDTDRDSVPDNDPAVPLDEARLGSVVGFPDSDYDGLSDLGEAMACIFRPSYPGVADSDADGLLDGSDAYPLYPVSTKVPYQTLDINAPLGSWPLAGRHYEDHLPDASRCGLYFGWDTASLYLGIRVGTANAGKLHLHLDADNNGLFRGADNFEITLGTAGVEQVVLHDAASATGDVDFINVTLPTMGFAGRTSAGAAQKEYQLRIPRDQTHGLALSLGEQMGLRVVVDGYGRMFERDSYFVVELGPEAPRITHIHQNRGAVRAGPANINPDGPASIQAHLEGITSCAIEFSQDVVIQPSDVLIRDLWDTTDLPVPIFNYNASTHVLTLEWAPGALVNRWARIHIRDSVHSVASHAALDGDILATLGNPANGRALDGQLPSGDGVAGGTAMFVLGSLVGDTDGDRFVRARDQAIVRNNLNTTGDIPSDIDGDGEVRSIDQALVRNNLNGTLPTMPSIP